MHFNGSIVEERGGCVWLGWGKENHLCMSSGQKIVSVSSLYPFI